MDFSSLSKNSFIDGGYVPANSHILSDKDKKREIKRIRTRKQQEDLYQKLLEMINVDYFWDYKNKIDKVTDIDIDSFLDFSQK